MISCNTAVVILNWNGLQLLKEFLPQVIAHTTDADICIIDNGSTDDSVVFVRQNFPSVKLVLLEENHGFAGGYNLGLKELKYKYFVLLNSDVAPAMGWLDPLVSVLDSDSNIAVVVPKILDYKNPKMFEYAGAAGGFIDYLGYPFCRGRLFDVLEIDSGQYNDRMRVFWASGAAFAIKSDVFFEVGCLDVDFFAHQEEIDLCWRINNLGFDIVYVPESSVFHLGGATLSSSNPRKTFLNFRNNLFMILKNHPSKGLVRILLLRMILDGVAAINFLIGGQFGDFFAVFRAHINFYTRVPLFYKKRTVFLRSTSVLHSLVYAHSIVWQYFGKGKKVFSDLDK